MPQIDPAESAGQAPGRGGDQPFTVQNLADMVAERAGGGRQRAHASGSASTSSGSKRRSARRTDTGRRGRRSSPSASWRTACGSGAATSTSRPASPRKEAVLEGVRHRHQPADALDRRRGPERGRGGRPRVELDGAVAEPARSGAASAISTCLSPTPRTWPSPRRSRSVSRAEPEEASALPPDRPRRLAGSPAKSVRARKVTSCSEEYWEDDGDGPAHAAAAHARGALPGRAPGSSCSRPTGASAPRCSRSARSSSSPTSGPGDVLDARGSRRRR